MGLLDKFKKNAVPERVNGAAMLFCPLPDGDADERYICGLVPILYLCRCPDKFVLCNLSGQKIAATTANSDG